LRQIHRTHVVRWNGATEPDQLAAEEPLEIRIGGEPMSVTMRTPGHDLELVAGMLLTEGLMQQGLRPILRQVHPNTVDVALSAVTDTSKLESVRRASVIASSCGLCGKSSIESVHQNFEPVHDDAIVSRYALQAMLRTFETAQPVFAKTGGVHAAGVFRNSGQLVVAMEDIGRHNAVDKVIGHAVLRGLLPLNGHILLVSGRASFEIVQKALGARIPIIGAVSAPSSLAVELAASSGQTLIGFLREGRCNIYTQAERVTSQPSN
jgi:FdhD protein